jgi:hypothetical protein
VPDVSRIEAGHRWTRPPIVTDLLSRPLIVKVVDG